MYNSKLSNTLKAHDVFRIVPDCSRAAVKSINRHIEPPVIETRVPSQPTFKDDIASQELIDAIDAL